MLGPANLGVLAFAFAVAVYGVLVVDLSASKRIAEVRDDGATIA